MWGSEGRVWGSVLECVRGKRDLGNLKKWGGRGGVWGV